MSLTKDEKRRVLRETLRRSARLIGETLDADEYEVAEACAQVAVELAFSAGEDAED